MKSNYARQICVLSCTLAYMYLKQVCLLLYFKSIQVLFSENVDYFIYTSACMYVHVLSDEIQFNLLKFYKKKFCHEIYCYTKQ